MIAFPTSKQLLAKTPHNNLVRACKIYLENDFIIVGFKALANFTYRVTMPFLNCVERANQDLLIAILPKLRSDLDDKKTKHSQGLSCRVNTHENGGQRFAK